MASLAAATGHAHHAKGLADEFEGDSIGDALREAFSTLAKSVDSLAQAMIDIIVYLEESTGPGGSIKALQEEVKELRVQVAALANG
jgi:ubiquinone biosynthesis protein UbiJ